MLFQSPIFLFYYLPVVVIGYFLIARVGNLPARLWLAAASLYFYAQGSGNYLWLLVGSILFNYILGRILLGMGESGATVPKTRRMLVLMFGVIANLIPLFVYKYGNFILENVGYITHEHFATLGYVLPLAISFFTFQQIAYLFDAYRDRVHTKGLISYFVFVTFFPQLIAGPIVHHGDLIPQFQRDDNLHPRVDNIIRGLFVFSIGLFKMVVISGTFAIWVDSGYAKTTALGSTDAWIVAICYLFQIYFDFSAYSDMAIGAGLLFNIRLPENFSSPYKTSNIGEFWRRWHITLSRWMHDYLYMLLGGDKRGHRRTLVNLFITFVVVGIWHGAGWTFVVFGVLHGSAVALQRAWQTAGFALPQWLGRIMTLMFVVLTLVFFRSPTFGDAFHVLHAMFTPVTVKSSPFDHLARFPGSTGYLVLATWMVVFGGIALFGRNTRHWSWKAEKHWLIYGAFVGIAWAIAYFAAIQSPPSPFIYFRF